MSSVLTDAILGSLTVSQCEAVSYSPGVEVTPLHPSGAIDATALFVTGGMPKLSVTTTDLATLLGSGGVLPAAGLYIPSSNVDIGWSRRTPGSTRDGNTSHTRFRGTKALAILTRITATQGEPFAKAEFDVHFLSSTGLADPIAVAVDVTLPSQTVVTAFRLGPGKITVSGGSSVAVLGVQSLTINPGVEIDLEKFDGAIYPINAYLKRRNPSMDITFTDEEQLAVWGPGYQAISACTFFLRKLAVGSTVVAAATAEHIGFTFADGIVDVQAMAGSGPETALPTLRITGETLTHSVATAIT
jgi:hypothetical protein